MPDYSLNSVYMMSLAKGMYGCNCESCQKAALVSSGIVESAPKKPPAHTVQLTVYGLPIDKVDPTGTTHAMCLCGCKRMFSTAEIERLLAETLVPVAHLIPAMDAAIENLVFGERSE